MISGHFIPSEHGKLFITQFGQLGSDTAILCLPSIAEELNLSRAVVAKQAQHFASNNIPCYVLDYFGTGDSEGEFEQASCDIWLENILTVAQWLKQKGVSKIILWGVRFGALFILSYQKKLHELLPITQQILWKPVSNGKLFSGQFLRIKQANSMISGGENINWRNHILAGNDTEVAGYLMTKPMLESMELLQISADFQPLSKLHWFELAAKEVTPLTKRLSSSWPENSAQIYCVDCPPFWQVPEIFSLPQLTQLNCEVFQSELAS